MPHPGDWNHPAEKTPATDGSMATRSVATTTAKPPTTAPVVTTTLLIVDARIADYKSLLADLPSNVMVRVIQADESGLDAMTQAIDGNSGIESIQILSHGSSGSLSLGHDVLNTTTLSSRSVQVKTWTPRLSADADILLDGCDIAAGSGGSALLAQLAALTGADIAASIDELESYMVEGQFTATQFFAEIEGHPDDLPARRAMEELAFF